MPAKWGFSLYFTLAMKVFSFSLSMAEDMPATHNCLIPAGTFHFKLCTTWEKNSADCFIVNKFLMVGQCPLWFHIEYASL